jgi:Protein of unknown function (DUF2931)
MKPTALFSLLFALTLTGCRAGEPSTPEETGAMPYGKWGFAFFTPEALPASVSYVTMIDTKQVVYTYRTLDSVQGNPDSIGKWDNRVRRHAYFNKARHPPVVMLFCWDSIIDKKTYETRITFPENMRKQMLTPTGKDSYGDTTWYNTVLFGLAPEGKVRIWLQNSGLAENLLVEPKKITSLSGDKLDVCKGVTNHTRGYGYTKTTKDFIQGKTYPYGSW